MERERGREREKERERERVSFHAPCRLIRRTVCICTFKKIFFNAASDIIEHHIRGNGGGGRGGPANVALTQGGPANVGLTQ